MAKKLKDCTKEELLYIIKSLTRHDDYPLQIILGDMEYEQMKKTLSEAKKWGKIADECRRKYIDILKKHESKSLIDIPIDDLEEAEQCLKDAQRADKKYDKLMKEVDAYGKS